MKLATGHPFDDDHRTAANRTAHLGRDLSMSFAVVCTKQSPAPCEHTATPAVGKKAEVADADQTLRQNVDGIGAETTLRSLPCPFPCRPSPTLPQQTKPDHLEHHPIQ